MYIFIFVNISSLVKYSPIVYIFITNILFLFYIITFITLYIVKYSRFSIIYCTYYNISLLIILGNKYFYIMYIFFILYNTQTISI